MVKIHQYTTYNWNKWNTSIVSSGLYQQARHYLVFHLDISDVLINFLFLLLYRGYAASKEANQSVYSIGGTLPNWSSSFSSTTIAVDQNYSSFLYFCKVPSLHSFILPHSHYIHHPSSLTYIKYNTDWCDRCRSTAEYC